VGSGRTKKKNRSQQSILLIWYLMVGQGTCPRDPVVGRNVGGGVEQTAKRRGRNERKKEKPTSIGWRATRQADG
jgi:hypothetical protein